MTYSDLTILMLKSSNKVRALVSDSSEYDAINRARVPIAFSIISYDSRREVFLSGTLTWKYAVPVLPNGTPLRIRGYYDLP